jgi:TetR/AcrR family transcriptional regulator, hemagglutinin/protease regulatory protein
LKRRRRRSRTGGIPKRSRLQPERRRAQLLACALSVFQRRGLGRAGHAEIARAAGVSVATVFGYFPTRPALVDAVLDEVERFYEGVARLADRRDRPVPTAILDVAFAFSDSVDSHPDHARIFLAWSTAMGGETWDRYLRLQTVLLRIFASAVRRGQREGSIPKTTHPEEAALLLVSSAQMIGQLKFTRRAPAKVKRFVVDMVRGAIGVDPQTG